MTPHECRIAAEELNAAADKLAAVAETLRQDQPGLRNLEASLFLPSPFSTDLEFARLYLQAAVGKMERAAQECERRGEDAA